MNSQEQALPKLRLLPAETPEELAHRFDRERRALHLQRETDLETALAPFKVGSVPYLNAVPLTRGIESQVTFTTPSQLAELLRADRLDAALVSVSEVLFCDRYDILDGIAIAALGEVQSVFLAHRTPLADLTVVHCDPASITSVSLLRVLLAEQGLHPDFVPLPDYAGAPALDAVLIIGDPALDFLRANHVHQIWDLGAAWYELTRMPFVYAVWALRRDLETEPLRRQLREVRDFGIETLDSIIQSRTDYDYDFRRDYLTWHIHYHLGSDEKRSLARFVELLRKHGLGPIYDPRFII